MKFLDMMDHIHVDEKWFFLSQQKERYLLLPEEKNLKWCVKSKSHITKVMFLCVIAHPCFNILRIHGGTENLGFALLVIGNQQREHLKTNLQGHYCIFRSPAPTTFLHPPTHFMYICVSCVHSLSNLKARLTLRQSSSCASYRYVICHTFPNK